MRFLVLFLIACSMLVSEIPAFAQAKPEHFQERDDIMAVQGTDPEMNAAIAKARASLPEFLKHLKDQPKGSYGFGFKFPLGGNEHIWVEEIRQDRNFLSGKLANEPVQDGHALGDIVHVPLSAISDWVYYDSRGRAHGHFTTQVLLGRVDATTAREIRAALGWD